VSTSLLEEALETWGIGNAVMKTSEEVGELLMAMHHWYGEASTGKGTGEKGSDMDLAMEVADVEIMMAQLRILVGDALVTELKIGKLQRLRKRLDNAKKTGCGR